MPLFGRDFLPLTVHLYNPFVADRDVEAFLGRDCEEMKGGTRLRDEHGIWNGKQRYVEKLRRVSWVSLCTPPGLLPSAPTGGSCRTQASLCTAGGAGAWAMNSRPARGSGAGFAVRVGTRQWSAGRPSSAPSAVQPTTSIGISRAGGGRTQTWQRIQRLAKGVMPAAGLATGPEPSEVLEAASVFERLGVKEVAAAVLPGVTKRYASLGEEEVVRQAKGKRKKDTRLPEPGMAAVWVISLIGMIVVLCLKVGFSVLCWGLFDGLCGGLFVRTNIVCLCLNDLYVFFFFFF